MRHHEEGITFLDFEGLGFPVERFAVLYNALPQLQQVAAHPTYEGLNGLYNATLPGQPVATVRAQLRHIGVRRELLAVAPDLHDLDHEIYIATHGPLAAIMEGPDKYLTNMLGLAPEGIIATTRAEEKEGVLQPNLKYVGAKEERVRQLLRERRPSFAQVITEPGDEPLALVVEAEGGVAHMVSGPQSWEEVRSYHLGERIRRIFARPVDRHARNRRAYPVARGTSR